VRAATRTGTTTVVRVEHHIDLVSEIADHLIVVDRGAS
jgi:ABC-type branched-subunit amino acid transport system ATPase component